MGGECDHIAGEPPKQLVQGDVQRREVLDRPGSELGRVRGARQRADRGRDDRTVKAPLSTHRGASTGQSEFGGHLLCGLRAPRVEGDAEHFDRAVRAQWDPGGGPV